jgi:DnaJ-class molecular chaperone
VPAVADADADDRQQCAPCRGTGQVISAKGGDPRPVTCPWCEGSGRVLPGHDAQQQAASTP